MTILILSFCLLFLSFISGLIQINQTNKNRIVVQSSNDEVCVYDRIDIKVYLDDKHPNDNFWLGIYASSDDSHIDFIKKWNIKLDFNNLQERKNVLKCEDDTSSTCKVDILQITFLELISNEDLILQIKFNKETNAVNASTAFDLYQFLIFPFSIEEISNGFWKDKSTLQITWKKEKLSEQIIQAFKQNSSSEIFLIEESHKETLYYQLTQRIAESGTYEFRLFNDKNLITQLSSFTVLSCDNIKIMTKNRNSEKLNSKLINPSFIMNGIAAFDGSYSMILEHQNLPSQDTGNWTISFFIYLLEDSNNQYRTLFYKGPGHEQRTPSAWIQPYSRHISLRLSTKKFLDFGKDSIREIPLYQWTSLTFTFSNSSHLSQECVYQYILYINKEIDTVICVEDDEVLPNKGNLYIGKDPWMNGIQGFMRNIRLYPTSLTDSEVEYEYDQNQYNSSLLTMFSITMENILLQKMYEKKNKEQFILSSCDDSETILDALEEKSDEGITEASYLAALALLNIDKDIPYQEQIKSYVSRIENITNEFSEEKQCKFTLGPFDRNITKARIHLERAAYSGHSDALLLLGLLYATNQLYDDNDKDLNMDLKIKNERLNNELIAICLYHIAVSLGNKEAAVILGMRYQNGRFLDQDEELASYYLLMVAEKVSEEYNKPGGQTLNEMHLLSDINEDNIGSGDLGEDDDLNHYIKIKADEGDIGAMNTLGDFYYWGKKGLEKNHQKAFHYFKKAADLGDVNGQVAAAGMYLKGEGIDANDSMAINLYEKAILQGSTQALNGLGFAYFYGGTLERNTTKAFNYFEQAAKLEVDGDSLFNAGHCYSTGIGTKLNKSKALSYYQLASTKFHHFNSIWELGKIYLEGKDGIKRSPKEANIYLKAIAQASKCGKILRQGFNKYLLKDYKGSALLYHFAVEFDYSIAHSNLAFLYQKHLTISSTSLESSCDHYFKAANYGDTNAFIKLGDCYLYGNNGILSNTTLALKWYSYASSFGILEAEYKIGFLYENGIGVRQNYPRARRYYQNAINSLSNSFYSKIPFYLAIQRIQIRQFITKSYQVLEQIPFLFTSTRTLWNFLYEFIVYLLIFFLISCFLYSIRYIYLVQKRYKKRKSQ